MENIAKLQREKMFFSLQLLSSPQIGSGLPALAAERSISHDKAMPRNRLCKKGLFQAYPVAQMKLDEP
jgi:hypothetical protein